MNYEKRNLPKGVIWGVVALIVIFAVSVGIYVYKESGRVKNSLADDLGKFQSGVADLKNLNPAAARQKFLSVASSGEMSFGDFASKLQSVFGGTGDIFAGFRDLASESANLAGEVSFLENNLPDLLFKNNGGELLAHLKNMEAALAAISSSSAKLSAASSKIEELAPGAVSFYIPAGLDLAAADDFLQELIVWFSSDTPRHIFVMLQNPAEMRPAGGFLGSYADITINKGGVESAEVRDINDIDRTLKTKTIPPQPLQALITNWRTADANWYFDFPASAARVLKFANESGLYRTSSTVFDGAIAVSPQILADILNLTGPVPLPDYKLTLDHDNFLEELQKIVERGQASGVSYPKKALSELAAGIFQKLSALQDFQKQEFISLAAKWLKNKDIMIYFSEADLEKLASYYGADGGVYDLPQGFEGDYLAIADANIGGGKSDLFVRGDISLESQINGDGTVSDHLVIVKTHEVNKSNDWWYKVTNNDYLQVFVPPASQIVNFTGGTEKKIYAPVNYAKNGYAADDFAARIDAASQKIFNYPAVLTYDKFGKEVFATWSKVAAGKSAKIVFDYTHRLPLAPTDGQTYQFIFEKQAGTFVPQSTSTFALPGIGAPRSYKFIISAPVGYKFKENNLPVYVYDSSDPASSANGIPGRLVVDLTLEKI